MNQSSPIKKRIRESFSKKAEEYDRKADLQNEVASLLRQKIKPYLSGQSRILDMGCGTGLVSLPLLAHGVKVHGVDMASGMISVINEKSKGDPNLFLTIGDGEFLPYGSNRFDLVLSGLAYHWIFNLGGAFREVLRVLKNEGRFAFTLPGEHSLSELKAAYTEALKGNSARLPPPIRFPDRAEVEEAMRSAGFEEILSDSISITRRYSTLWDLLKTLKDIGAGNPMGGRDKSLGKRASLEAISRIYQERFSENGMVYASYEIIYCSGKKK